MVRSQNAIHDGGLSWGIYTDYASAATLFRTRYYRELNICYSKENLNKCNVNNCVDGGNTKKNYFFLMDDCLKCICPSLTYNFKKRDKHLQMSLINYDVVIIQHSLKKCKKCCSMGKW